MDRHHGVDEGLFRRLQGRKVMGVETDQWASDTGRDWFGVMFDGADYLSVYAVDGGDLGPCLEVGFRRRCPEPFRNDAGRPLRRCTGFADHGGPHL